MSDEKHQQLIDEGLLWPDGTRKETCPMCGKPLDQGETLAAVATGEPVATSAEVSQ